MEREDPLERIEREQRERKERNKDLRKVTWVLAAVAVLLAGALAYIWYQKSTLIGELNVEKEELTGQIEALQSHYAGLSSDYDSINSQLDSSREEIAQLVDRIKKTEATNRAKIRQYEKELGTLRAIMRNYITQIDSLNTLNKKLTQEAASARREADESKKRNEQLAQQIEDLTGQVAAGAVIKARGLKLEAYNASDKVTDRSSRVVRMLATLSLVENELAPRGPMRVYIRVKDPDGMLLLDGSNAAFTIDGQAMAATASREVDYEGAEVEMSIYVNNIPSFMKGIYTVEAYTLQSRIGTAELMLR